MTTDVREKPATSPRLQSIDALRGFDMFWIIGADAVANSLAKLFGLTTLADQFKHVEWHGFRFYDLIFPLFLFIVGVVLPFSLSKYSDGTVQKFDRLGLYRRIFLRSLILVLLGLIHNGLLQFNFEKFRWPGVLQRIGICYFVAAMIVVHLRLRWQVVIFFSIVIGYWALLKFVPAPGFEPFDLSKEGCLVGYIDRRVLPGRLYYGYGDNEGLLSTIPAIATTLLGSFAGYWLRTNRTPANKLLGLIVAAAICLIWGYLWSYTFPLNKILYTSSFVLVTGGWSLALLATFYGLIDVLGLRNWSFFFVVIGMNAITIYVLQSLVDFKKLSQSLLDGVIRIGGEMSASMLTAGQIDAAQKVVLMLGVLALKWWLLWYLYRNKTFLRV